MRRYLATLHKRPPHHKKRFAFMVSAVSVLFIFAIWALVTFGADGIMAREVTENKVHQEVGPFESLRMGLASSFMTLRETIDQLRNFNGQ